VVVQSSDPIWHFGRGKPGNKVKVPRMFSSNSYLVLRSVAIKGIGIALLPYRTVRDDLRDGTLVEILKSQAIPERPLYAAFAPGAPGPEKVPSFVDLLADWFRNDLGIRVLAFSAAGGHQRE
jgi:DNA-binding transcriptional LysR family regulator